jgi:hypothetical protein
MALEPQKRKLPPWLANVKRPPPPPLRLQFRTLLGPFVSDHNSKTPVSVTRVFSKIGFEFEALLFRTAVHEDLDGAPRSFAPPIGASATERKKSRGGLSPLDHINNATGPDVPPVFHPLDDKDTAKNTWKWTGVVSMTPAEATSAGREIDQRDFLRDKDGRFPVMQRKGTDGEGFYAPQTAIATRAGEAVNPLTVQYAALSTSLKNQGNVGLGDFGLAIRASTGVSSPFIYADAGGGKSTSVGECSRKFIQSLFGGGATEEKVCYIVFPNSRRVDDVAEPELMRSTVRSLILQLEEHENHDDLPRYFADHATSILGRRGATTVHAPLTSSERISLDALLGPEGRNIRSALKP